MQEVTASLAVSGPPVLLDASHASPAHTSTMSADQEHWVARPGELVTDGVEETATRVGGLPLFPAGCPSPDPALTACQECGKQLALILQVGASTACRMLQRRWRCAGSDSSCCPQHTFLKLLPCRRMLP